MSEVLEATTPGWRPDPSGRYEWRYWDGGWTNRVANSARPAGDEPEPAPVPADPWAALRVPVADAAPAPTTPVPVPTAPVPVPVPTAPVPVPTTPVPLAPLNTVPPPAPPAAPGVHTFPTAHDGSSGTIWDQPYRGDGEAAVWETGRPRRGLGTRIVAFVRSFWEQPESYHSPNAGPEIPPPPRGHELDPLPNYGRAALVMLSACGVAVGAYLPWISGTIDAIAFERTGYEQGHAWGFTWAAAAFSVAAILGARRQVFGWVTMAMSVVVAALVAHQLLDVHDQVVAMNRGPTVDADVGIGLWIMLAAAGIGLVAAFRLDAGKID